jgi:hypothetical protein
VWRDRWSFRTAKTHSRHGLIILSSVLLRVSPVIHAVEPYRAPKPPKHLGEPEQELWRNILADFQLDARR